MYHLAQAKREILAVTADLLTAREDANIDKSYLVSLERRCVVPYNTHVFDILLRSSSCSRQRLRGVGTDITVYAGSRGGGRVK